MDSLNRIFELINEAKKKKRKKGMVGSTPKGKANRYDHDSFGMQCESSHKKKKKKKFKKLVGKQNKLDRNKNGKLDKQDFKMLRGESSEIVTVLSILKEAYQDELISEEAFLAIADPIMRSLMNEEEGPKKVVMGTIKPKVLGTAKGRRKRIHAEASDKRSLNPGK